MLFFSVSGIPGVPEPSERRDGGVELRRAAGGRAAAAAAGGGRTHGRTRQPQGSLSDTHSHQGLSGSGSRRVRLVATSVPDP